MPNVRPVTYLHESGHVCEAQEGNNERGRVQLETSEGTLLVAFLYSPFVPQTYR